MINSYNNIMIDIKFSLPGHGSNLTFKNFHGNNQEQKINYHINSEISQADGWIVLENLKHETETCIVPKNNIFYLNNETSYKKNDVKNSCHPCYTRRWPTCIPIV